MTQEKKIFQPLSSNNVCLVYSLLHEHRLVSFPLATGSKAKIEAIVASINNAYFGVEIYSTVELKATAYLYFLIKDHPFIDGNKRTATIAFEVLCEINGLSPDYGEFGLDIIAVFIEQTENREYRNVIEDIAGLLFPNSGK